MQILNKIELYGTHHIWTGPLKGLYGRIMINGVRVMIHRYVLEQTGIVIPDGAVICHHCDIPACVNPDHLYIGTRKSNAQDFWRRQATRYNHEMQVKNGLQGGRPCRF